jgi:hypothetical protein
MITSGLEWKRLGGYVGVVLMLAHAALSAYWASGGTALLRLLSDQIVEMADERSAWVVGMLWGIALLKALVAATGVGLLRNWFSHSIKPFALALTWVTAIVLVMYGGLQIAGGLAMVAGISGDPSSSDRAFLAYLLLWAPLWLAIGLGFSALSWNESFRASDNA